jgi:hypothetical protein
MTNRNKGDAIVKLDSLRSDWRHQADMHLAATEDKQKRNRLAKRLSANKLGRYTKGA